MPPSNLPDAGHLDVPAVGKVARRGAGKIRKSPYALLRTSRPRAGRGAARRDASGLARHEIDERRHAGVAIDRSIGSARPIGPARSVGDPTVCDRDVGDSGIDP